MTLGRLVLDWKLEQLTVSSKANKLNNLLLVFLPTFPPLLQTNSNPVARAHAGCALDTKLAQLDRCPL